MRETPTTISISPPDQSIRVDIDKSPFRIEHTGTGGPRVSEAQNGLYFVSSGARVSLERTEGLTAHYDRALLTASSSAGLT